MTWKTVPHPEFPNSWAVAYFDENGEQVRFHSIGFSDRREAVRGAQRLNDRDEAMRERQ